MSTSIKFENFVQDLETSRNMQFYRPILPDFLKPIRNKN